MSLIVPPGGMAGFSQMTAASKRALSPKLGYVRSKQSTKRAKKRYRANKAVVKGKRTGKRYAQLTKGSAAAKRRMAQLRKMRKKK
jgi:hypothetical protein